MQYNSSSLNFIENSLQFVETTIGKLQSQKQIITHVLPAIVGSMIIGINLIYYDLLKAEDIVIKLSFHASITLFFITIMFFGIRIRKKRYNNDYKPLIEELESIKQNFKNHV